MKSIFIPVLLALSLSVLANPDVTPEPKATVHEMTKFEKFKDSVKHKWDEFWAEVEEQIDKEEKAPKVETKLVPVEKDNNGEAGPDPVVEQEEAQAPVK